MLPIHCTKLMHGLLLCVQVYVDPFQTVMEKHYPGNTIKFTVGDNIPVAAAVMTKLQHGMFRSK